MSEKEPGKNIRMIELDPRRLARLELEKFLPYLHSLVCDDLPPQESMKNKDFLHGIIITLGMVCTSEGMPAYLTDRALNGFILEMIERVMANFGDGTGHIETYKKGEVGHA